MRFHLIQIVLRIFTWSPLWLSRGLGGLLGLAWWISNGRGVRVTRQNLQKCFPEMDRRKRESLVRQSLRETCRMALETPAVWFRGNRWRNARILGWERRDLFEQALASPKGLLLLVPHFGNWEMAGIVASTRRPTTAIYREPRLEEMNELLKQARDIGTTTMVPATSRGVMAVLKALREGGMTVILPDQQPGSGGGIFSPFFGHLALTMTLVHGLLRKGDIQVLLAYARREPGGFVLGFSEPDQAIRSEDVQQSVDALNRSVETLARTAPQQYQWEYKRFRKQPPGEPVFYQPR